MTNSTKVDWVDIEKKPKPDYRGYYYVSWPVNPIGGCATSIVYFNGTAWYEYGKRCRKTQTNEWVAWAKIPMPKDYHLDWKKKFPYMFEDEEK